MFSQAELITPSWAMPGGKFAKPHDVNNLQRNLIFPGKYSGLVIPAKHLSFPAAVRANASLLPVLVQVDDAQPAQGGSHAPPAIHLGSLARSSVREVLGSDPQNNPNPRQMFGPDVLVPPLSPHQTEVEWSGCRSASSTPNLHPAG